MKGVVGAPSVVVAGNKTTIDFTNGGVVDKLISKPGTVTVCNF